MRRLTSDQLETLNFPVEDSPENCSTKFLLTKDTSTILVDNPLNPKLLIVTYPSYTPAMRFFYGKADRVPLIRRFLKNLDSPTDLVIPVSMLPLISNNWPIRFTVPVMFLTAETDWVPQIIYDPRIRLLHLDEASILEKAFYNHSWLWEFFSGPEQLLADGQAIAAVIDGELACVATTLAYTKKYCELGVVTRPEFRGAGLALKCCQYLSKLQYEEQGRLPCWRTDFDNIASRKVANRLGLKELESSEKYIFISNYQHVGAYATVAP